jgi:hypothetical protein
VTLPSVQNDFKGQLERAASAIDVSLRRGDCASIREQWTLYTQAARETDESGTLAKKVGERRVSVLTMCPELKWEIQ